MGLSAGTRLGPYEIVSALGAGGMGEVYRARDTRLGREVALKVIPSSLLSNETARLRFQNEARALATLSHPNIASLFEFDSEQGVEFLVMELVEGESLGKRLSRGALEPEAVTLLGAQLMEGLRAAHAKGIVHRDLKPENLVISDDGRLKILDFGVAKVLPNAMATAASGEPQLTAPGRMVGTLAYMAPEQIRDQPIDERTDIYAAGAVLYEMTTGRQAFSGGGLALVDEILNREPPAPSSVTASVPPALEMLIAKAMDKDPRHRYQSVDDMLIDLQRLGRQTGGRMPSSLAVRMRKWKQPLLIVAIASALAIGIWLGARGGKPAGGASIESVAVLPLENLSRDPEQEFFADGMTDELITNLGKIEQLRVISRTSMMQYKGVHRPLQQIARELKVDGLVEGSVTRAQNRVRITAKLLDPATEKQLWGDTFEGDIKDVLSLQDQVARSITEQIRGKLTSQQHARLSSGRAVNPEAYDAYLKGRQAIWRFQDTGAIPYFQKAIALEPQYAEAYAGLADAYTSRSFTGLPPMEVLPKAREAAQKALALDDSLAEAHAAMGLVRMMYDFDWRGAEVEFRKALEIKPGNPISHYELSILLSMVGRHDEAIAEAQRAISLDPLDSLVNVNLGWRYQGARRFDQAIAQFKKTLEAHPDIAYVHGNISQCLLCQGKAREALAELGPDKGKPDWAAQSAVMNAAAGNKEEARRQLAVLLAKRQQGYYSARLIASVYAALGDKQEALRWMNTAREEHDGWTASLFTGFNCEWDHLRSDPGFQDLRRRFNLP
jgi:eukaryotic-like serine/threonine-protein kinase